MGKYIADQIIKQMIGAGSHIKGAKVNVLGVTCKENVQDLRNSKVIDLIREFESFGIEVFVHDPVANPVESQQRCGLNLVGWEELPVADALVVAVVHEAFFARALPELLAKVVPKGCFIDIKSRFDATQLQAAGLKVWRL